MNGEKDRDEEFKLKVKYVSEIIEKRIKQRGLDPSDDWCVEQFDKLWEYDINRLKILKNIVK